MDGIYNSRWYFGSIKFQKVIPLIIQRGRTPAKLTLYKFSTVSYKSFCDVSGSTIIFFFFEGQMNAHFFLPLNPFYFSHISGIEKLMATAGYCKDNVLQIIIISLYFSFKKDCGLVVANIN